TPTAPPPRPARRASLLPRRTPTTSSASLGGPALLVRTTTTRPRRRARARPRERDRDTATLGGPAGARVARPARDRGRGDGRRGPVPARERAAARDRCGRRAREHARTLRGCRTRAARRGGHLEAPAARRDRAARAAHRAERPRGDRVA